MAGKLVGVRFQPRLYKQLQAIKRELQVESDAEAVRQLVRDRARPVTPSMLPVFEAPAARSRRRTDSSRLDDVVYEG